MKTLAAILLLCAACAPPAAAQKPPGKSALKVRVRGGRNLVVTEGGRARVLRVADKVDAARLEDASVIFVSRAGGERNDERGATSDEVKGRSPVFSKNKTDD
ncbi:MAG TPA: hypothetical protein VN228_06420 [Pyrinomonadaceae bacterium]|nr:hypothetical protein [Pyrinomonadaceae bacterium]